ncbi:hypothetical protein C731_4305 [Mycolicibacterium hassiacum DSM 44199]|jgi:hypothetical protein|uniref:Uncharacterized protein n=1 Tax=Mycolicibacterium hassiacum (strain DSM 44199 / CIP 105218 / JCM 12690 / 3849) TaxID=1122247 RepID=K5BA72_MYCHD|nr:hypothetical protein [Mycolicibacterium hassiacum]EKF21735.1 hypothetical protein C731_4305 [Mycolicibacterium hassiacum DSM 44199]MBX5486322.1 hypothetical protein [Mycolicibacterium hassiacum]MDA4088497.1 hypothetical protein [Mycolicibacterium hassiacum DSM 44199]PZN24133.1 MAG: hypothetical protein DIU75_03685 [Mycolicibacterium hassiacum]VCT92597.1 hypothetical protein MHAS_04327 [Mycolicibacterium hassiacum DSM 44199]
MSALHIARNVIGWSRIGLGALLFVAPRVAARAWLGPDGDNAGVGLLFRSIGARDIALGAGLLAAEPANKSWSRAGVAADVGDVIGSLVALGPVPTRRLLPGTLLAAVFVVAGLLLERNDSR